jgi:hypothetical protein
MIGFMRGHVYCYDFNERRVIKDLGKAAEIFCYRLVLGADGHIYGCTKSGQMFKVDTEKVELENMEFHVPDLPDNYTSRTWYRYMLQGRNHPSGKYMYIAFSSIPRMYKLEFATGKVTLVGNCIPMDGIYELGAKDVEWLIRGFDFDKDGVLWLAVKGDGGLHNETPYTFPDRTYLVRWDPDNGEAPYCCGLLGKPERVQAYVTEMEYDHVHDRLYWVDTVSGATPLSSIAAGNTPKLTDLLLGLNGGAIGETCAIALLLGLVYLLVRRVISWHIPVSFVGTVFVLSLFMEGFDFVRALALILSGALFIGAFFMATDYVTSPTTPAGKVIFGVGAGLLTFLIRYFGVYPEGVSFAILFMNILTPYIDSWTAHKVFGGKKS